MTRYVLEYRPRLNTFTRKWQPVHTFTDPAAATEKRNEAIKREYRGTKDWRVRPAE